MRDEFIFLVGESTAMGIIDVGPPADPIKPQAQCTMAGPPCHDLLTDSERVMSDRSRWPNHVCEDVSTASTETWARGHVRKFVGEPLPDEVEAWITTWPLPVGAWCSPHVVWERFPLLYGRFFTPGLLDGRLALFPTIEHAAVILAPDIPFASVVMFGIVDTHPAVRLETDGYLDMWPVTPQFVRTGWQNTRADAFVASATRWWEWFGGKPLRPGRPRGTGNYPTAEAFHQAIHEARADCLRCNVVPDTVQIVSRLYVERSQYFLLVKRWGLPD